MPGFLHAVSLGVGVGANYHAFGQVDLLVGQEHMFKKSRGCILYGLAVFRGQ